MRTARAFVHEVTVEGDRQHGKTDLLLMAAIRDARLGKTVLYECKGWTLAADAQRRMLDGLLPEEVLKATRSNGDLRVTLKDLGLGETWPGDGRVVFVSNAMRSSFCGRPDTYILDDTDRPTLEILARFPQLTAIYRSHCTGELVP